MTELHHLSLTQLSAKLQAKELSATELARHYLKRMAEHQDLGAYLDTHEEATL
ncbi:MAG: hypothetical protein RL758_1659, partial [Pseudomonadota bacterium]